MKINRLHAIIGFLLVIVQFTDFSSRFKGIFDGLAGALILYFAMRSIHDEVMKKHHKHRKHDSFVENRPKDSRHDSKVEKTTPSIEQQITEDIDNDTTRSSQETETNL